MYELTHVSICHPQQDDNQNIILIHNSGSKTNSNSSRLSSNYSLNRCDKEYNIHQALEEVRKETPRYSQAITDFQVQAVDATHEITHNFLDSQKEIINSIQSAWTPVIQRTTNNNNNLTTATTTTTNPFLFFSPGQIADI